MSDLDSLSRAQLNLDRAFEKNKINERTYRKLRENLNCDLNSVFDSDFTRSVGVIETLRSTNMGKFVQARILCSECDHYGTGLLDSGYGCGYRNAQMLLSAIKKDANLRHLLFNNSKKYSEFFLILNIVIVLI